MIRKKLAPELDPGRAFRKALAQSRMPERAGIVSYVSYEHVGLHTVVDSRGRAKNSFFSYWNDHKGLIAKEPRFGL